MSDLNRIPLQKDTAGIIWVLVLDGDNQPVTDLTDDDARISAVTALVLTGPTAHEDYSIDLETDDHALVTTRAAQGIYGIPFPAALDDGAYALTEAVAGIFVTMVFTGSPALPMAYAGNAVVSPPVGAFPANVTHGKGQPINDLDDGKFDVSVSHMTDTAMQALTDLNQLYDISLDTNVSPPVLTKTRRSDSAVVGTWNVTLEDRLSITEMTEPA